MLPSTPSTPLVLQTPFHIIMINNYACICPTVSFSLHLHTHTHKKTVIWPHSHAYFTLSETILKFSVSVTCAALPLPAFFLHKTHPHPTLVACWRANQDSNTHTHTHTHTHVHARMHVHIQSPPTNQLSPMKYATSIYPNNVNKQYQAVDYACPSRNIHLPTQWEMDYANHTVPT